MPPTEALRRVAGWLACPHCGLRLGLAGDALGCGRGHRFDVARQGYVNLLGRAAPANADTPAMCEARERFLRSGHYDPIRDAVCRSLGASPGVVEVGAGTGWYLAGVLDRDPTALGLATDVSVAAARRAARAHPRAAAAVADTWGRLPLADGTVTAVLCVFAPRNPDEFERVLAPGGRVVVVVPGPGHLMELRRDLGLLGVGADKVESVTRAFAGRLERHSMETVTRSMSLTGDEATALVAMGPNAFHRPPDPVPACRATLDVTVLTFTRRAPR